jgi:hypothetical protein
MPPLPLEIIVNPHETPHSMPLVMATSLPRLPRITPNPPKCWGTKGPCALLDGFAMGDPNAMVGNDQPSWPPCPLVPRISPVKCRDSQLSSFTMENLGPSVAGRPTEKHMRWVPHKIENGLDVSDPRTLGFAIWDLGLGDSYLVNREIRENRPNGRRSLPIGVLSVPVPRSAR